MNFVTGATGLVGSYLVAGLLRQGAEVTALRRPQSDLSLIKRVLARSFVDAASAFDKIIWVEGELSDYYSLETALAGADFVYHCAATVSFRPSDKKEMHYTNIQGTANLVNAALHCGVKKFCHVSSVATLGRAEPGNPVTEKTGWKTSGNNSSYAISKYGAEREVWRGIAEGLKAVIVNPAIILGAGNWSDGSAALFKMVADGMKFYTKGINGFVDVKDVVDAMLLLMQGDYEGERYIVSAADISYEELFKQIASGLKRKPPSIYAKPWMGELAWRFYFGKQLLTGKKAVVTRETARTAKNKHYYPATKLRQAAGFQFRAVEETIAEICGYYLVENS
ncbi:MAG: NAD-dependent epimerase/dehydratase family protein [Bacteroidales bacterium]|jgi:nucleoside-diphosphate-sugar epimerase|nr:NAD-dependent epimerase/dehydratase family protein [Bacteroidales bacterium]